MTPQEMKQEASNYNHQRYLANGKTDTKMSAEIYNAFLAGCNCAVRYDMRNPVTDAVAWKIYNFINDYKAGNFGTIPLQDALNMYFERYNPDGNFVIVGANGEIYERYKTRTEAEKAIGNFEANDLAAGVFEPNYYDVQHV